MSYQFSASELFDLRTAQSGHMLDVGNIQPVSAIADSYGQVVETWPTNNVDIACGLDMRPGSERHGPDRTITSYEATVRLPIGTEWDMRSRFRVTKLFGETLLIPLVFNFVGPVQRGPSGVRGMINRVET